jgi:alpha-L-arabinofuranosidase
VQYEKGISGWRRWVAGGVGVALCAGAAVVGLRPVHAAADPLVFGDGFGATWSDFSWWATVEPRSTAPVHDGAAAIAATITNSWGGLSFRTTEPVAVSAATTISFWLHGGTTGAQLAVFTGNDELNNTISSLAEVRAPANAWALVTVTSAQLGNPIRVARINIVGSQGSTTGRFSVDELRVGSGGVPPTTTPPPPTTAPPTTVPPTTVPPTTVPPTTAPPTTAPPTTVPPTTAPPTTAPPSNNDGTIRVNAAAGGIALSPRMWGSNISMYEGGYSFADATVRARSNGKVGLHRYPGGQDSQKWGWASCQLGYDYAGAQSCASLQWTAKPGDFIGFVRAVGGEAVVTLNINATSKENAAFVAFMNGSVGDNRVIGVDQKGADWRTVGYWAQIRANAGYGAPLGVTLWEFGNETYGGLPGKNGCVTYGWEVTWTCNATEYINGIGTGAQHFNGYRETKAAMRAVDPNIQLGAPAMNNLPDYNNWTADLLRSGGADVDFLEIHPYFVWIPPADTPAGNAEILAYPQTKWSSLKNNLDAGFNTYTGGRRIPFLISEYNLTPGTVNDPSRRINGQGNAMVMADSVGAMNGLGGFMGSNNFELYGTAQADGSWFAMLRHDGGVTRTPLYWAWVLWSRFGATMLPATSTFDAASSVSAYAGRRDGNTITLYVLNKTGSAKTATIAVDGVSGLSREVTDVSAGTSIYDDAPAFNGQTNPNNDLSSAPGATRNLNGLTSYAHTFPPYSMSLVQLTIGGTPPPTTAPPTTAPPTTAPPTTAPPTTVQPGGSCRVTYSKAWDGGTSFGADITITNLGAPLTSWRLEFTFPGNQRITSMWGATSTQAGAVVTASDAGWNANLGTGAQAGVGFSASYTGANSAPISYRLNGNACSG